MSDREFWSMVRAALLTFVAAIEKKYMLGKYDPLRHVSIGERDNVAG